MAFLKPSTWSEGPRKWWGAFMGTLNIMDERNLGLIAAGIGFFGMLAVFPGIAALISVWGLVSDPSVIEAQIEIFRRFVPADGLQLIEAQLDKLVTAQVETLSWTTAVSTGLSLFWARSGMASMIRGLNAVYREDHRGNIIMRNVTAILLTVALLAVLLVALTAVVAVPVFLAIVPLGPFATVALQVARWAIAAAVMLFGLGFIYRYAPNRRAAKVPWVSPGALIAVTFWGLGSAAFAFYIGNFGRYNEVYGSLGAGVALLMWFYLSAYFILFGAAMNAELELRTLPDTTTGPPKPMGERGAYVADTYVKP